MHYISQGLVSRLSSSLISLRVPCRSSNLYRGKTDIIKSLFNNGKPPGTQNVIQRSFNISNSSAAGKAKSSHSLPVPLKALLGTGAVIAGRFVVGLPTAKCDASVSSRVLREEDLITVASTVPREDDKNEATSSDPQFDWVYFWHILKPQLHYFLGAVATALVVAIANVQIPVMLGDIVNVVAEFASGNAGQDFWTNISDPALRIIKVYIVQAGFTFAYIICLTLMGEGLAVQLRQELFESLLQQDIAFYDTHRTGELVNRLTADVQDFKSSFKMCVSQGIRSVAQMVGCGVTLYHISPPLAAVTAVVVPAIIGLGSVFGALLRGLSRRAQHQVALSTGVAEECLGNIRTVRSFASEEYEAEIFAAEIDKSRSLNEALGFGIGLFQAGSNLFLNGCVLGTLWLGGSQMAVGSLRPGDLMTFLASSQTIQRALSQLSVLFGYYVRGVSAGIRVFEYVKLRPSIPLRGGDRIQYHTLCGSITFDGVDFSYPTRPDQEVLSNFSLTVPAGKVVALVGESGAGKTTIGHLLERFYDVQAGSIRIDDKDIRTLDPAWLRGKLIGFIHQEPVLFQTSVMENIRYGRPNATDKEVMEAAKIANADEFITQFPRGYQTVVGERGVTVSGGQKQRIAIARALLKNPRILVLDEATSALDAESERVVQASLEKCCVGRTVLVIAHRLSTIQAADLIAVMKKGKLVEIGTHDALKRKGGYYAELIRLQEQK